jgi:pimeloyl-ACP methyl ester carboxylesterase
METQYFERPEGTLAYSDYGGDGEPVLMLPGLGALRREYRYLAPALKEAGFRAVTVDLRGHGESSVPWSAYDIASVGGDVLALIDHLGAGSAHVVGNSFAAGAAVWAAAERPERARSLVLIGPSVREGKTNTVMKAVTWLMMRNPWRVRTWLAYYRTLYPTRKPDDFREYLDALGANLSERGRFDAAAAMAFASRLPSAQRLRSLETPALIVIGTRDRNFPDPAAEGRYIADQTGGKLELIEDAGHYPQTEMPDETAPVIIDFLKQTGSRRKAA